MTILNEAPPHELVQPEQPVDRRPRNRNWPALAIANTVLALAVLWLLAIIGWSLFPSLFTSHDPINGVPAEKFAAPGSAHLLGTDYLGRDLYARIVYGARMSVLSALVAVTIGLVVGSALGAAAGYLGGLVNSVIMRVVDALLAIPGLLLSLAIVVALGFSTINAAIAVGVASVATFARLVRAEVLRVRSFAFVEAASLSGCSSFQTLTRHIIPNALPSVLSLSVLNFGSAIMSIAALAFLGYGSPPPEPDWGTLVSEGLAYLQNAPWLAYFPGFVIVLTVLAINRIRLWPGR